MHGLLAAAVLWVAAVGLRERKEISQSKAQTAALPLLIWYPITRASHAEMRRRLEAGGQ